MGNPLQDRRTATEWASDQQVIEIARKIGGFEDLAAIVEADLAALASDKIPVAWRDNVVSGRLAFGFADEAQRIPTVIGSAAVKVDAVCQRCLQLCQLTISVEPRLLLLERQDAETGYDEFEVWELDQLTLRPQDIVEELLIMALPFAAMHDNVSDCEALSDCTAVSLAEDGIEVTIAGKMKRPFADLRSQMQQNDKDSYE